MRGLERGAPAVRFHGSPVLRGVRSRPGPARPRAAADGAAGGLGCDATPPRSVPLPAVRRQQLRSRATPAPAGPLLGPPARAARPRLPPLTLGTGPGRAPRPGLVPIALGLGGRGAPRPPTGRGSAPRGRREGHSQQDGPGRSGRGREEAPCGGTRGSEAAAGEGSRGGSGGGSQAAARRPPPRPRAPRGLEPGRGLRVRSGRKGGGGRPPG